MEKIYIFDVDGTLTPSRRKMTEDFEEFFSKWSKENTFYLVSGSNLEKIREQVPNYLSTVIKSIIMSLNHQRIYLIFYKKNWKTPIIPLKQGTILKIEVQC